MTLDVAKLILDVVRCLWTSFDAFGRRSMSLDVVRCLWTSFDVFGRRSMLLDVA